MVTNYETAGTAGTTHDRGIAGAGSGPVVPDVSVVTAAVTPTDRVRWGPILAGLFTALSTLIVLSVLGAAVAGSAFDPGDNARNFGWGAGIWSAVSMLLAFCLGGWMAARSAAVRGHGNGVLNGTMVWIVAIPLMLWMISSTIGAAARTAASAAGAIDQQTISQATDAMRSSGSAAAGDPVQQSVQQVSQSPQSQSANSAANQERAADTMARSAWGTLIALLLSLAAAAAGGYLGARSTSYDDRRHDAREAMPAA